MDLSLDTYFQIIPEFDDVNIYAAYTVSNGCCRAKVQIYNDLENLRHVVAALREKPMSLPRTFQSDDEIMEERCSFQLSFSIHPEDGGNKTLRTHIINDANARQPYRAEIDIILEPVEAVELADELENWIHNPSYHFIWIK